MVVPHEGATLKCIPTKTINGVKCAKIDKEDVLPEIAYWQTAILCMVMGANHPFGVIEGFIHRIWKDKAINKIVLVRKDVYMVRFLNEKDKLEVIHKGLYYFDNKPFLVKQWNPELNINTNSLTSLPVWVQFPELDIKYWDGPFPEYVEFINDYDMLVRQAVKYE
ncbi:hypothetical protein Cgig2_027950 [Carnegiea gigantea]|uniref:DUF4283 domain-containing protein n=1 Tax=Carnegiea gigantea TaxID=171969 RepID=A0A9Q1JP11_9CARY|nr:hypothetical protein Cgig2_027950 [Carnegiea gigantea]